MTLETSIGLVHFGGTAMGGDRITHLECRAAGFEERRVTHVYSLHMAANTKVLHRIPVGRARNGFAIGDLVDAFNHIALRSIVRAEAGTAIPGFLAERI